MVYSCLCCGYQTLRTKPPGTYHICPICFWEDDDTTGYESGSNRVSLRQAQANFRAFGACEAEWLADVRPPLDTDCRDSNWQTLDEQAEEARRHLIASIEAAFATVKFEEGITVREARALDDYEDAVTARQIDRHVRWQDIPDAWLERFHDVFAFMNAKGLRHALPAYMRWCLRYERQDTNTFVYTCYCLKTEPYRAQLLSVLEPDQSQLVEAFLTYIESYALD